MRIVFMGTPDFAVEVLKRLAGSGEEIVLAVTQPDRVKGRGRTASPSPVKAEAEALGIPVFTPEKVRRPEAVERIREAAPDLIVVAAFGQILPQELLDIPELGCINVHASLLPKYRGAAPIQWAVLNGEKTSGVTLMKMDAGLDTGDILVQEAVELAPDETGESLYGRLAALGGDLLVRNLDAIKAGSITPVKQDDAQHTYAGMLKKEMGRIDWSKSAAEIERFIRGMYSWPCAYTSLGGKTVRIFSAGVLPDDPAYSGLCPGTVAASDRDSILVVTGEGLLAVRELQMEGRKRMSAGDFLRGTALEAGTCLG